MVGATDYVERIANLRELIEALDQRVPHAERAGEAAIARDASDLRRKALERIAELEAAHLRDTAE